MFPSSLHKTCVAPDYILVTRDKHDALVEALLQTCVHVSLPWLSVFLAQSSTIHLGTNSFIPGLTGERENQNHSGVSLTIAILSASKRYWMEQKARSSLVVRRMQLPNISRPRLSRMYLWMTRSWRGMSFGFLLMCRIVINYLFSRELFGPILPIVPIDVCFCLPAFLGEKIADVDLLRTSNKLLITLIPSMPMTTITLPVCHPYLLHPVLVEIIHLLYIYSATTRRSSLLVRCRGSQPAFPDRLNLLLNIVLSRTQSGMAMVNDLIISAGGR